jgi:vanillate O-demethylase ferredoxin subunit
MGERESLRVHAITCAAQGINFYELRDPNDGELPPFTAGAHLDVHLGNGMVRQYSLANPQAERRRYVLGVKRDARSRGGSAWIHEHWRCGDRVEIGARRNNFSLHENAPCSLLLGGGIGITPLLSMAARLQTLGRSWQLHYSVRTRAEAVPTGELDPARVYLHVDDEHAGALLDLAAVLGKAPSEAHLYCCGPEPMLDAFLERARTRPRERVHVERFSAEVAAATTGGFHVELARSKQRVYVAPGQTIIDALRGEGLEVVTSCEQGICGTCETRVLAGTPDHRDLLLSDEEKAANTAMMICCSGSKDDLLVLDL